MVSDCVILSVMIPKDPPEERSEILQNVWYEVCSGGHI